MGTAFITMEQLLTATNLSHGSVARAIKKCVPEKYRKNADRLYTAEEAALIVADCATRIRRRTKEEMRRDARLSAEELERKGTAFKEAGITFGNLFGEEDEEINMAFPKDGEEFPQHPVGLRERGVVKVEGDMSVVSVLLEIKEELRGLRDDMAELVPMPIPRDGFIAEKPVLDDETRVTAKQFCFARELKVNRQRLGMYASIRAGELGIQEDRRTIGGVTETINTWPVKVWELALKNVLAEGNKFSSDSHDGLEEAK